MLGSACVLILDPDTRHVLAISRGDDHTDWALPGGHVEFTDLDRRFAAARELGEETGVLVSPSDLAPIYTCPTTSCTTYAPSRIRHWPERLRSEPFEGYVAWQRFSTLCAPSATFRRYARKLFSTLGYL